MKQRKPCLKTIVPEELATIKASVERAWLRLVERTWRIHKSKRLPNKPIELGAELAYQTNRKYWARWLKSKVGQSEILAAAQNGDVAYFLRQARFMSGAWLKTPIYRPRKLDVFLISHWAEKRDGLPELFYLTPSDLTLACNQHPVKELQRRQANCAHVNFKRRQTRRQNFAAHQAAALLTPGRLLNALRELKTKQDKPRKIKSHQLKKPHWTRGLKPSFGWYRQPRTTTATSPCACPCRERPASLNRSVWNR
jgi:hypothetical protein